MTYSEHVNPADVEQGIVAYSSDVIKCPYCNVQCNTVYIQSSSDKRIITCSQKCADNLPKIN